MGSRTFATRMTCFSLVSAIESDLRHIISIMDTTNNLDIPNDVSSNAKERFKSHFNENYCDKQPIIDLIEFSDFSDLAKILSKNKNVQNTIDKIEIERIIDGLNNLIQTRNRTCHSRPLEYNDINDLTEFSIVIKKIGSQHWWTNINEALENLNNPTFALSLQIPSYWKSNKVNIYNNLPLPEFDDTGFLGRKNERIAINDLIYSHTRVISLIGEGGVGKTALALRCLYDVLERVENSDENIYDMVVWVTLKANRLTNSGVVQLRDAIVSTLGLFQDIGDNIGLNTKLSISDLLEEISLYMSEFKILLCIDNLETIEQHDIRDFLAGIPNGSKVLITTRIGLGEIEYRYKLDSLDKKSSVDLIRKLSTLLNIESLKKRKTSSLEHLVKKLYYNPLLIKWYVLGIGSGKQQDELLSRDSLSYKEALKFCFENLYNKLSTVELEIIKTIACLRNSVTAVELRYILSNKDELEIAESLHNLNNSSMLKSDLHDSKENKGIRTYALTDIASDYLSSISSIEDSFYADVREKNKELRRHIEENATERSHYHLDITNIHANNRDEKICAVFLKQALSISKSGGVYEEALIHIHKAKEMMPSFSESYRINAQLLSSSPYKAESEYEAAIEYNSESVIAYYSYAKFLVQEEDFPYALEQIDRAIELKEKDETLISFKALILTRMGDYKEAISLYEDILPVQRKNSHRKFRISTYQQLISCYKRYAERLLVDSDLPKSNDIAKRIFELFHEMFNSENYDERSLSLFSQIIVLCDRIDIKNTNLTQTNAAIKLLDDYRTVFSVHDKNHIRGYLIASLTMLHSQNKQKIETIIEDLIDEQANEHSNELSFFKGCIKDIRIKNGKLSFGFITGDDNKEYFFHRGEVNPHEVLDNKDDYRGARVGFSPSHGAKGPTAKNVHLL